MSGCLFLSASESRVPFLFSPPLTYSHICRVTHPQYRLHACVTQQSCRCVAAMLHMWLQHFCPWMNTESFDGKIRHQTKQTNLSASVCFFSILQIPPLIILSLPGERLVFLCEQLKLQPGLAHFLHLLLSSPQFSSASRSVLPCRLPTFLFSLFTFQCLISSYAYILSLSLSLVRLTQTHTGRS